MLEEMVTFIFQEDKIPMEVLLSGPLVEEAASHLEEARREPGDRAGSLVFDE